MRNGTVINASYSIEYDVVIISVQLYDIPCDIHLHIWKAIIIISKTKFEHLKLLF